MVEAKTHRQRPNPQAIGRRRNRCGGIAAALETAGFRPSGGRKPRWSHESVQALFVGVLINRRKRYPRSLRSVLPQLSTVRQTADYTRTRVSEVEAKRLLRRSREFVSAIMNDAKE